MSWASYVENLQAGPGKCKYAAILGKADNSSDYALWAESTDKSSLNPQQTELLRIGESFMKQDQSLLGTGVEIGGVKFFCLKLQPELMICQGKGEKKDCSLVVTSGTKTILVGFNPDSDTKTNAVCDAVVKMQEYLKNNGY